MVWENGCTVIVMMTALVEDGDKQSERYWPDEGSSLYHIYEVHFLLPFHITHKQMLSGNAGNYFAEKTINHRFNTDHLKFGEKASKCENCACYYCCC